MFRVKRWLAFLFIIFASSFCNVWAQGQLQKVKEFKLPVPWNRGIWWSVGQSRWYFSTVLTPDHSLLVYEPNKNGKWPLLRVRNWWTDHPVTEALDIPGWSGKDAKHLERLRTDLQMTPNGRFALAFAEARWDRPKTSLPGVAPPNSADVLITVIDLDRWQIVSSLHAASLHIGDPSNERIISDKSLVLEGVEFTPKNGTYHYKSLALPVLAPGRECATRVPPVGSNESQQAREERLKRDAKACAELLESLELGSMEELVSLVRTGQPPVPRQAPDQSLIGNSVFRAPGGEWYALDSNNSILTMYSASGELQKREGSSKLLCRNQPVQGPAWDCSCSIVGTSGTRHELLAACLTQRDGFLSGRVWLKQWLSVFHTDDFHEIGFVRLPRKDAETKAVITAVGDRTYILTVVLGESVTVYILPTPV